MTERTLIVLLNGRRAGEVIQRDNKLRFLYDDQWRQNPRAMPLSLSMPLTATEHDHDVVSAYMWGLLPDNRITLDSIGKEFHVSANNCFALLSAIGEDCPGAVQFLIPDELPNLGRGVEWLDDRGLEKIIRTLANNPSSSTLIRETGRFSLPGAQPKVALFREGERWGVPIGRTPTTHILKPTIKEFEGQAENEVFCLNLAGRLGLSHAETTVMMIADTAVVCSKRYDRKANSEGQIIRLHQEDLCQTLGVAPERKYQNEGGPGIPQIVNAITKFSSKAEEDRLRFMRAIMYNFIILGTDAHAKNYSLLIAPGNQVRLAPLYDVSSFLPYATDLKKLKMAMKIGDEYKYDPISKSDWGKTAAQLKMDGDALMRHLRDMIARIPGEALSAYHHCRNAGLKSTVLELLLDSLWARLKTLSRRFGSEALLD